MTMNRLPPQAYTSETVSMAYAWLRDQPDSIKEMATSVEMLVGLYLKAKRHGNEFLQSPSMQSFKSELKTLQNIMGEFDGPGPNPNEPAPRPRAPMMASMPPSSAQAQMQLPNREPSSPTPHQFKKPENASTGPYGGGPTIASDNPQRTNPQPSAQQQSPQQPHQGNSSDSTRHIQNQALAEILDRKSWAMAQEAKAAFNLSDESEALRLLISLGFQQANKLIVK